MSDQAEKLAAVIEAAHRAESRLIYLCDSKLRGIECAGARDDLRELTSALAAYESAKPDDRPTWEEVRWMLVDAMDDACRSDDSTYEIADRILAEWRNNQVQR